MNILMKELQAIPWILFGVLLLASTMYMTDLFNKFVNRIWKR